MDPAIILTYRCNSRCSMCHIWKNPTHPNYEIPLEVLEKLPGGFHIINLTGGEPTLRDDLLDICDLLYPKTRVLEISTNGLRAQKLEAVVRKYPDVKIRVSTEGMGAVNDAIRGEKNGYELKIDTIERLLQSGATDLGIATTIQDENIDQLLAIYRYCKKLGIEFATSTIHNGFQFHKNDNYIYERQKVAKSLEPLITEMLGSWHIKTWFRAYLNLGLMRKIAGLDRLGACRAATGGVYIDPWCDVYACNVRNDLLIGNLRAQSWEEIINGERIAEVRRIVARCSQNCWMVGVARGAMKMQHFPHFPRMGVLWWVLFNKLKLLLGGGIAFDKYVDLAYSHTIEGTERRISYLKGGEKRILQTEQSSHYSQLDDYSNR